MPNPAFLIEGQMEQRVIQRVCAKSPAVRIGTNGRDVNLETLARFCVAKIRLLRGRYWPFIIIFDREGRRESAADIIVRTEYLIRCEIPEEVVRVVVADRSTENWILFDHEILSNKFKLNAERRIEDGAGKGDLQRLLHPKTYHETTTGVDMLLACRPSRMSGSPSFARLVEVLNGGCAWLTR